MWQEKEFETNEERSALNQLLAFLNERSLTPSEFDVIACPEHPERIVLLYRQPERVTQGPLALCQEDLLRDQWHKSST